MSEADRKAAEERFRDDFGCGRSDAMLAARAELPLDDDAEPNEAFATAVADRASHFVEDVAELRGNAVGVAARRTIEQHLELARDHRQMYYVKMFEDILDQTPGPVAAPESAE